jgi:hypothetical protein
MISLCSLRGEGLCTDSRSAMGSSPSATLNSGERLGLVEVHEGLESDVSSECGAAVAYNGLGMDSWPAFPLWKNTFFSR